MKRTRKQRPDRDSYKEFQYNGFTVMVPRSVLKAWEAQGDKQLEMINVLQAHYKEQRNKVIAEGMRCWWKFSPQKGDSLLEIARKLQDREVKKEVLGLLKYRQYRAWHLSLIDDLFKRAVMMAAYDGDAAFFKGLGERLKRPCKPAFMVSKLKELLLLNWGGTGICFCWFSDRALLDFIKLTEKDGAPFTMDAIRQERDRLYLPKLKPALVRSVTQDGKQIFLDGAKPARASTPSIAGLTFTDFRPDETQTGVVNRKGEEQAHLHRLKTEKESFDYATDRATREQNKRLPRPQ
jgi:hypothetical protein